MIRPILYPDLVALSRVHMDQQRSADEIAALCDRAHSKGLSLEDVTSDLKKAEGFSLNSNRGLCAFAQAALHVLAWRRDNQLS